MQLHLKNFNLKLNSFWENLLLIDLENDCLLLQCYYHDVHHNYVHHVTWDIPGHVSMTTLLLFQSIFALVIMLIYPEHNCMEDSG